DNHLSQIDQLIKRERKAQDEIKDYSQEDVRKIAASIGWFAVNKAEEWANINYEETKMGDVQSKINRTQARARGLMRDLNNARTVGVIEEDHDKQLVKIGKPVGTIAAL